MNTVLFPSGLPDYLVRTSCHSVSNHQRRDRGSPGCQRVFPRHDRLRHLPADSPTLGRPNRVHLVPVCRDVVTDWPFSTTVAPHPALRRRSYGSIPHDDASPQEDGLAPSYAHAISGALVLVALRRRAPRAAAQRLSAGDSFRPLDADGVVAARQPLPATN